MFYVRLKRHWRNLHLFARRSCWACLIHPKVFERRRGAIATLHELLRQGLDVEASSQVQDWPCFLIQALNKLMASEIVDLLPWENLADSQASKQICGNLALWIIVLASRLILSYAEVPLKLSRNMVKDAVLGLFRYTRLFSKIGKSSYAD
ncbi:hypothetical protein Sjap_015949 [Stephania japonica]|uniref:Uncharacterized protein n=1 Tax=Stephania japonica TaxID=461633 RepID=A0AAP0IM24_9MAGN